MATLKVPTPLRSYTNGQTEISVQGGTVGEVMRDLVAQFPTLRPHLFNGKDELRPFVNLFLNNENVKDLQGLDTPLKADDRLMLIPSIAGGRQ
jgi:molybdopterin converting factor small subunit